MADKTNEEVMNEKDIIKIIVPFTHDKENIPACLELGPQGIYTIQDPENPICLICGRREGLRPHNHKRRKW